MNTETFKQHLVGSVNTWIRLINEEAKSEVINNKWDSEIMTNGDFRAYLTVRGKSKVIVFTKNEWHTLSANTLGNLKFKKLHLEVLRTK